MNIIKKNNYAEAEKLYKKILKIKPNHFDSNFLLGTLSAQTSKYDQAIEFLNKAKKNRARKFKYSY